MLNEVEAFAVEARRFRAWADNPPDGVAGARAALLRVSALYNAALHLPDPWHPDLEKEEEPPELTHEEWRLVYDRVARALPLGYYGVVSDPIVVPPEEPVIGDIGDDIADIYRDVVPGLAAFDAGARLQARYEWAFGFQNHWGAHAADATKALHAYLSQESPESLLGGV